MMCKRMCMLEPTVSQTQGAAGRHGVQRACGDYDGVRLD
jgi:hypothetical protein